MKMMDLPACLFDRWSPQIGDPTIMGWVAIGAYFAASFACFAAGRARDRDRGFWLFLTLLLLLLGVNKQLDLQSALASTGRCVAHLQGWYDDRERVRFLFIVALLAVSGTVMLATAVRMSARLHRVGIALLGFGLLLTFVAERAIYFNHLDAVLKTSFFGTRMNWTLELGGIALILLNAIFACKGARDLTRASDGPHRPVIRPALEIEQPSFRGTRR